MLGLKLNHVSKRGHRLLTTMVKSVQNKRIFHLYDGAFQRPMSFQCWEKVANLNMSVRSLKISKAPQIARFMGPTWAQPGSWQPQLGSMLAPWILLSGTARIAVSIHCQFTCLATTFFTFSFRFSISLRLLHHHLFAVVLSQESTNSKSLNLNNFLFISLQVLVPHKISKKQAGLGGTHRYNGNPW